jgi:hypothetical protein
LPQEDEEGRVEGDELRPEIGAAETLVDAEGELEGPAVCPPDLPPLCDGRNQKFSVLHALECKEGGLVISRHNEIRDELINLPSKVLSPFAVRDESIPVATWK